MAKTILQINKFEGGLINYYDSRDLPENALNEATGVMCDIQGKVRIMGGPVPHTNFPDDLVANFVPGYGLFSFNADHSLVTNEEQEVSVIAIQNDNFLNFYENNNTLSTDEAGTGTFLEGKFRIGSGVTMPTIEGSNSQHGQLHPVFYYVDGGLRVNDRVLSNETNKYARLFKHIDKTWFAGTGVIVNGSTGYTVGPQWFGMDAFVFPPSCIANSNKGQLICNGNGFGTLTTTTSSSEFAQTSLSSGNVHLHVVHDTGVAGEFVGDSELQFGMSFVYDDGQESPITAFKHTDGTNAVYDSSAATTSHALKFKAAVGFDENWETGGGSISDAQQLPFDPRVAGVRFYLIGDSLGLKDDPEYLFYFHWGKDDEHDTEYLESHAGDRIDTFNGRSTVYGNYGFQPSSYLVIKKVPSLTYRHLTGIDHNELTTASKYKCATIINRRAFIGGVRRLSFDTSVIVGGGITGAVNDNWTSGNCIKQCGTRWGDIDSEPDRMLISEENQFDIFPGTNEIDVAINDGEQITQLMSFADRVLQFKNKTLYVINVSKDIEYLESQHKYMGVDHPYQTCMTEYGPVWVNRNGCYLFDGEKITNLITNKINPSEDSSMFNKGWQNFIGKFGMVGYIQELKQIVLFEDPLSANANDVLNSGNIYSDCMIYDLDTNTWSHGEDVITGYSKSNIIMNWDDSCMFLSEQVYANEQVNVYNPVPLTPGRNATWTIGAINQSWTATNSKLSIGAVDITPTFTYPAEANVLPNGLTEPFGEFLKRMIEVQTEGALQVTLSASALFITRQWRDIEATGEPYANNTMAWTNAPTASYVEFGQRAIQKESCKLIATAFQIDDEWANGELAELEGTTQVLVNLTSPGEVFSDNADFSIPPAQTILSHMAMDSWKMHFPVWGNNNEGYWSGTGSTGINTSHGFFGDKLSDYRDSVTGEPFLLNHDKCELRLIKTGGGDFNAAGGDAYDGVSSVKIDLNLSNYGYHQTEHALGHSLLIPNSMVSGNHSLEIHTNGSDSSNYSYLGYGLSPAYTRATDGNYMETGISLMIPVESLEEITSLNEDELINGVGDELDYLNDFDNSYGLTHGRTGHSLIPDVSGLSNGIDMTWQVPGVVFRVSPYEMIITILGDQSGLLSTSTEVVISNASNSANNFNGEVLTVTDSYSFVGGGAEVPEGVHSGEYVHEAAIYSGGMAGYYTLFGAGVSDCFSPAGQFICNQINSADIAMFEDAAKVTVLKFDKSVQSEAVQSIWNNASTYGDHNTVRFTYGETSMAISNSGNPVENGFRSTAAQFTIHPRRNGSLLPDIKYKGNLQGNDGLSYHDLFTYTTPQGATDMSIANAYLSSLIYIKNWNNGVFQSVEKLMQPSGTINITNSGLTVNVRGDYTKYLKPGDLLFIQENSQITDNSIYPYVHRINSVEAYNDPYTPVIICDNANQVAGGADSETAWAPVKEYDGDTADGDYSNCSIVFAVIKVTSFELQDSPAALRLAFWTSLGLNVNKFDNSYSASFPQKLRVTTRDIDFGIPSSMKAFYKIVVTHKGSGGMSVLAAYDGSKNFQVIGPLEPSMSWIASEFYFDVNKIPRKAHSIQIRISGSEGAITSFELNDITLIYRSI